MIMRPTLVGACALIPLLAFGDRAAAHTGGSTGYVAVAVEGATVRYTLTLWPATLPSAIGAQVREAAAGDAARREQLLALLRPAIVLVADGQRCAPGPASLAPLAGESVKIVITYACPRTIVDLRIRDDTFDVFGTDHHTLARVDTPAGTSQFALTPQEREARVRIGALRADRGVATFVRLGMEHILTGYDHLLFLLGLLLPGGGVLALVKIVTAFTVAHSITLSLAVLDVVVLPERLVEAVIALSIAAVAAENLFRATSVTHRWVVSFAFGLVHGVGFSAALREMGLPADGLLFSLFGFNAGVEAGQALVVVLALPVLAAVRRMGYERRLVWSSSMAILLIGLVLFVERAFL